MSASLTRCLTWLCCMAAGALSSSGAELSSADREYFESRVRPILAEYCYPCHSSSRGPVKAGLELDWQGGWQHGGNSGPAIVPGNPNASLLIRAVRYTDPDLQMPPKGKKLSSEQIAVLSKWVEMGAPDPRLSRPDSERSFVGSGAKAHWAFQPVGNPAPPAVQCESWVQTDVDRFILATLEANGLSPNPPADKRTLIRRAYFDLIGLPPSVPQVTAFENDQSSNAFEKVLDSLLALPQYGERWGRHWLDVARYADSKGQPDRRRESSVFPYAWTYRDYVIKAFNEDKPYDQFILEQLAADKLPLGQNRGPLAALGFLTLGDHFNGNANEIINDRIDVTSKAFLGLTVSCARCHDHKFDPIPQADYYSLHGIFASSVEPLAKPELGEAPASARYDDYRAKRTQLDTRLMTTRAQNMSTVFGDYKRFGGVYLFATRLPERERAEYVSRMGADTNVLRGWQQATRAQNRQLVSVFGLWNALARIPEARFSIQGPRLIANLGRDERSRSWHPFVMQTFRAKPPRSLSEAAVLYGTLFASREPSWESNLTAILGDAVLRFLPNRQRAQYVGLREQSDLLEMVHPGAPARAPVLADSPTPKDSPIFIRGEAENRGPIVPRRFLEALSGPERRTFRNGSGRLELAQSIASTNNPLTARVMANRVWMHHFGQGFVPTPDDLGVQCSPPTHPELLEYLARALMADGWSIKKLHKRMMLSATYQQSSRPNPVAAEKDPFNRWLARANLRRLEFEPLRDSLLMFGGNLDPAPGGHPVDLSQGTRASQRRIGRAANRMPEFRLAAASRRTIYGFVDRADPLEEFNIFDVATPSASTGRRFQTIVPQQSLYLMNSPLVLEQVRRIVKRPDFQAQRSDSDRLQYLYGLFFQRSPSDRERAAGLEFVSGLREGAASERPAKAGLGPWEQVAHALLLTNEAAFVD